MTSNNANPAARAATAGTTLLIVLLTIAVLSLVAGNLMWSASARYHVTYQSSSWQEALVAAEAGVDVAMLELRNHLVNHTEVFNGPGSRWVQGNPTAVYDSSKVSVRGLLGGAVDPLRLPAAFSNRVNPDLAIFPDNGHAYPLTAMPARAGEGNTTLAYRVYVDVPDSDAIRTKTAPADVAKQALAQPAPGTDTNPENGNLVFISQPDGGAADFDTHGQPINLSRWWWRIRAVGYAGVSGPARPSPDSRDARLRRFSFFTDWRNGGVPFLPGQPALPLPPHPQVSRVVEVLAQPRSRTHFALIAEKQIDLGGQTVLIDSYDSTKGDYDAAISQPAASASNGTYTAPGNATTPSGAANPDAGFNVGWLGNIATNGKLIGANGANVQGSAMTNNGTVTNAQNVTGAQDPNFFQDLTPIKAQNWTADPNYGTITSGFTQTIAGSDPRSPTRIHLNGVNLTHNTSITLVPDRTDQPRFVKIYIEGDLITTDTSAIHIAPNVSAIVYVTGKVSLVGTGIDNQSKLPTHLVINGVQPPAGTLPGGDAHSITIAPFNSDNTGGGGGEEGDDGHGGAKGSKAKNKPNGDFNGIVYAPQHDLFLSGNGTQAGATANAYDFAGAFAANNITVSVNTAIHFDESLRGNGQLGGYKLVSWFEDTTSHVGP